MKRKETARKMAYAGAGAGLVLFGLFGLLPGSLIGGALGLNIAGSLFGLPVSSALLPRLIVGASMLLGIVVSAMVFIVGLASLGSVIGCVMDSLKVGKTVEAKG